MLCCVSVLSEGSPNHHPCKSPIRLPDQLKQCSDQVTWSPIKMHSTPSLSSLISQWIPSKAHERDTFDLSFISRSACLNKLPLTPLPAKGTCDGYVVRGRRPHAEAGS